MWILLVVTVFQQVIIRRKDIKIHVFEIINRRLNDDLNDKLDYDLRQQLKSIPNFCGKQND